MGSDGKKTVKRNPFKEPSTWASIAAIAAVASGVPPEVVAAATGSLSTPEGQASVIVAVVAGIIGIALPERK